MSNSSQGLVSTRDAGFTVKWVGAQRNVLQGDISGHIALASLSGAQNLYAVGPAEGLRGEVSIFDSVPSISRITGGVLGVENHFNINACFVVYAQVSAWQRATIQRAIGDPAALETHLLKVASELGVDVSQPFPFLIDGTTKHSMFHVLDKRDGLTHTPELHEKAKVRFVLQREPVKVIGFYSNRHRGIFTPTDANIHMHVKNANGQMSGHLEKIQLERGATLAVPRGRTNGEAKRTQRVER
ncbi:MAG: hypothetical protein ACREQ2_13130 [Candidatus Binatia bacterium]